MKHQKGSSPKQFLPSVDLSKRNAFLFAAGLLVLIIGYLLLSVGPWDNPLSRTVAPLVLLAAYIGIFIWAILARNRRQADERPPS